MGWEGMCEFFMLVYLWVCFTFSSEDIQRKSSSSCPWDSVDEPGTAALATITTAGAAPAAPSQGVGSLLPVPQRSGVARVLLSLWPVRRPGGTFPGHSRGPTSPPGTTLPTSPSLTRRLSPRVLWERKVKRKQKGTARGWELCWAQAFPTPANSLPRGRSDLPLPEPACPRDGRARMESGRRLTVEGGNLYIFEKTEEQIVGDAERQRTHRGKQ